MTYNDTTVHYTLLYTHRIIYYTTQPAYMYYNIQATRAGYGSQRSKYYNDYQTIIDDYLESWEIHEEGF